MWGALSDERSPELRVSTAPYISWLVSMEIPPSVFVAAKIV
jgi:hypothetical protein